MNGADALTVVHVDEALIALDKPSGLLAVPGRGPDKQDCLSERARQRWPDARIVHRLDQATSGLMLLARGAAMQRALSQTFAERRVHKRYEAVVHGVPTATPDAEGWSCIDLPLIVDWPNRPRSMVDAERGKPSRTLWRALPGPAPAGCTRLALRPLTGRSHQLRVHLLALGHPIVGDALYAPEQAAAWPRLHLHACALELEHPLHGQPLQLHSAAPF